VGIIYRKTPQGTIDYYLYNRSKDEPPLSTDSENSIPDMGVRLKRKTKHYPPQKPLLEFLFFLFAFIFTKK
jgi:hypothetical protein